MADEKHTFVAYRHTHTDHHPALAFWRLLSQKHRPFKALPYGRAFSL
jgi:hypothetical protein